MSDAENCRPFSEEEVRLILDAADRTPHVLRSVGRDTGFVGCLVRFYLYFGVHPSVLAALEAPRIDSVPRGGSRPDEWILTWKRPKTKRTVRVPVPDAAKAWLGDFLSADRPANVRSYLRVLDKVSTLLEAEGHPIHLNPRRFRHTTAVMLKRAGVPDSDIQDILAVHPTTLQIYARRPVEEMADLLRSKGWGQ